MSSCRLGCLRVERADVLGLASEVERVAGVHLHAIASSNDWMRASNDASCCRRRAWRSLSVWSRSSCARCSSVSVVVADILDELSRSGARCDVGALKNAGRTRSASSVIPEWVAAGTSDETRSSGSRCQPVGHPRSHAGRGSRDSPQFNSSSEARDSHIACIERMTHSSSALSATCEQLADLEAAPAMLRELERRTECGAVCARLEFHRQPFPCHFVSSGLGQRFHVRGPAVGEMWMTRRALPENGDRGASGEARVSRQPGWTGRAVARPTAQTRARSGGGIRAGQKACSSAGAWKEVTMELSRRSRTDASLAFDFRMSVSFMRESRDRDAASTSSASSADAWLRLARNVAALKRR